MYMYNTQGRERGQHMAQDSQPATASWSIEGEGEGINGKNRESFPAAADCIINET